MPPRGINGLVESAGKEVLGVTHWFEPTPSPEPYAVTVRFTCRRCGVEGPLQPGDRITHDETVDCVVPGSGPVAVTARIHDINPGEWEVTAQVLEPRRHGHRRGPLEIASPAVVSSSAAHLWQRWAPPVSTARPARTCPMPLVRVPGVLPGIWAVFVALGMAVALLTQSVVIGRLHVAVGPALTTSLLAIAAGVIGAKVWFVLLHRGDRLEGWCIQGFITAAAVAAVILLSALHMPLGAFLDATAPGLMFGLAVGRVGCFLGGCCGGPPTSSRWALWSSDQRVGARRVPTQLLESLFAMSVGLVVLVAVLTHGPAQGAFFVAAVAAYTLGRQGLLRLRLEPRRTAIGQPAVAILAALALAASIAWVAR